MTKYFYSEIIDIKEVLVELDSLDLSEKERDHLAQLLDSNIHHTVLDTIFSELNEEDKNLLIEHLRENDHKKIWDHLHSKVDNIEDKIKAAADDLKKDLHKDLKEARTIKKKEEK